MADTKQKKTYTNAELTKILRDNVAKLPYSLRKGVDLSRLKAVATTAPLTPQERASGTVADVQPGSRDTVEIRDPETFAAHPYQMAAHEVGGHLVQNGLSDADYAKFQPVNQKDPYNYGGTEGLKNIVASGVDPRSKLSVEQYAEALQYKAAHDEGYATASPADQKQWDAIRPTYQALEDQVGKWQQQPYNDGPITSDNDPRLNNVQIPQPDSPNYPPPESNPTVLNAGAFNAQNQPPAPVQPQQTVQTGVLHATNVYSFGDPAPGDATPPAGVSFDAPLSQATTVPVSAPTGNSASNDSGAPSGVTFDSPLQAATTLSVPAVPQSVSSTVASQPAPIGTISATPGSLPNDPMAAKIALWSANVQSDLKNGTSITPVGKFLKAMGAHGFDVGNSPEVGEFMGSLPLGLLKAIQGRAEMVQPGQRWQGIKDTTGGLVDAGTIPSAFLTPEAGEAADALTSQASRAARAVQAPFTLESIQPELQQGIRDAVNGAAKDLGVQPSASSSIRDVANDVAQAAKSKASGLFRNLDNAVGGTRFQTYQEQLDSALQELRDSISEVDPDAHGKLIERINNLESAKQKAYQAVKDAGMDPEDIYARAQNLWRRGSALEDLGSHVEKSTSGMRPELAADANKTNPETVSTTKIFPKANQMYNDSRLQVALGEQKAKQLLQTVDAAHLRALKIAANQKALKLAGRLALYGGGYEALRHGASHLLSE